MNKKILNILAIALALFTYACSDLMDDLNKNVDVAPVSADTKFAITDAIISTGFNPDYTFYASIYMEHNVGIWNQMFNAEIRTGEVTNATTYNNAWNTSYATLYNLKAIIEKCSEGGTEAGNYLNLGIAQILTAYNLAVLTDAMGDVPWSEALQPLTIKQPKLDKQEEIYKAIFKYLDDAIVNLSKPFTYTSLGAQDLLYKGKASNWIKFAHGLKARYLMRLSHKNPQYAKVIEEANLSFANAGEQAQLTYDGSTMVSPFYAFLDDRDYFGASQSLKDKLDERNDPRADVYFIPYPGEDEIEFAPNGTPEQTQEYYGISGITDETAPTPLLSYHEIEFLKAEAHARLGHTADAETALKKAITAAFAKVGLDADDADDYYTSDIQDLFEQNPLQEIMIQKYLASYEEESFEAYNDYRRMRAMGDNFIILANPANTNKFPWRFVYGTSDVVSNPNVNEATGNGMYVYTEKVWWAGGTR